MEIKVYNGKGSTEGALNVSDRLFHAKMNSDLVYQVATSLMSNMRQVLAHTKTRAEVAGGGKKPWRQKGTGRARHGSIRSPIWIGGGVAHGPSKDVNFKKKINKAQSRAALAAVLSSRVHDGHLVAVDEISVPTGKTRDAVALFRELAKALPEYTNANRILVVTAGIETDKPLRRATANLPHIDVVRAQDLNTLTVLSYPYLVCTKDAVAVLEKMNSK